jgi:hypothetical protein
VRQRLETEAISGLPLPVLNGYCTIQLTQGKNALVDSCDYPDLSRFKWHAARGSAGFYARRGACVDGKRRGMPMHRDLVGQPGLQVDHANCDTLDNRRENLRPATSKENGRNRRKQSGASSRYKGVSWHHKYNGWVAVVMCEGHWRNLGVFDSEIDAGHAYNLAAKEAFGEFARLNDIPEDHQITTRRHNGDLRARRQGDSSKWRGVAFHRQHRKWQASIRVGGKQRHLGLFSDEAEAARAFNKAAAEFRGDRAVLNDVPVAS